MGQYFRAVLLDSGNRVVRAVDPDDYGQGIKFGASMLADSPTMTAVEYLLSLDGGARLVWAGDYADDTAGSNLYFSVEPSQLVRYAGMANGVESNTANPNVAEDRRRYICNADSRQFFDKGTLPRDNYGNRLSPLSRLTVEAGGFDTGPWARQRVYVTGTHPGSGFSQINADPWLRY